MRVTPHCQQSEPQQKYLSVFLISLNLLKKSKSFNCCGKKREFDRMIKRQKAPIIICPPALNILIVSADPLSNSAHILRSEEYKLVKLSPPLALVSTILNPPHKIHPYLDFRASDVSLQALRHSSQYGELFALR